MHAFEARLSIQGIPEAVSYPKSFEKLFSPKSPLQIITFGGQRLALSSQCSVLPIADLHDYLIGLS
jgi:hypothetical protein